MKVSDWIEVLHTLQSRCIMSLSVYYRHLSCTNLVKHFAHNLCLLLLGIRHWLTFDYAGKTMILRFFVLLFLFSYFAGSFCTIG